MSEAERESRRWMCIAGARCEAALSRCDHERRRESMRRDDRDMAAFWSGVAFRESKRIVRMRRARAGVIA